MEEEKVIGIRIQVDNSDAEKSLKDVAKQINNAFKNVDTNQLIKQMNQLKTTNTQWLNSHNRTAKGVQSANKKMASSFKALLNAMMPFLSVYAAFSGLKKSINDAMESIETDNMFNTVFGSSAKQMNDWVKEVNQTLGLGITDTKKYTATISQMGRAMGLTGLQAQEMSQKMAMMAGDISSFYDTDIANVQADLRSALSGSFETMDKYGIVLRATTIQQFAYANGIAKTGAELTNAQRAMATTMMIEQQLGLANGDLARSINSPANQARILRSNLADLSVALGECFMPIVTVVLPILNTFVASLTTTINAIANFISQVFALFGVDVDFGGVGGAIDDMASSIESADVGSGDLAGNLADGADSAKKIQKSLSGIDELNILSDNSSSSGSGSSGSGSTGSGVGTGGIDTGAMDNALSQTETKFSQWATKVANALQSVWGALKNGWNSVDGYINTSLDKLKQAFANLGTSIEGFLLGCWNNGGEELIYNIGRLGGAFVGLALDISGQVVDAISKLFDHMNPEKNTNTRKFIEAMNNALKACQDFALSAGGWLKKFMDNGGQSFLNNIGDIAVIVGTILVDAFGRGIKLVKDFMDSWAGQALIEGVAKALEWASEVLEEVLGWVKDNQEWFEALGLAVLGAVTAFKAINGTLSIIEKCTGLIRGLTGAGSLLAKAVGFLASPFGIAVVAIGAIIAIGYLLWDNWDWLCEKAGELGEWISKKWGEIKDAVVKKTKEIVDGVKQWWSDLLTNTKTKFTDIKTAITTKFSEIYNSVKTKAKEIKDAIVTKWTETVTSVKTKVGEIYTSITTKFTEIVKSVKTKVQEIYTAITTKFNDIKTNVTNKVTELKTNITNKFNEIKTNVTTKVTEVKTGVVNKFNEIKTSVETTITNLKTNLTNKWNEIKTSISNTVNNIKTTIVDKITGAKDSATNVVNTIKTNFSNTWNSISSTAKSVWDTIKTRVTTPITSAKTTLATTVEGIKTNLSTTWSSISSTVKTTWDTIKSRITTPISSAKTTISGYVSNLKTYLSFSGLSSTVQGVWDTIKTKITSPISSAKSTVSTYVSNIKSYLSFSGLATTVGNVFTSIKTKINTAMEGAKTIVTNAVSKLKSAFNFSWSLPNLKIPTISVSGGKAPYGIGGMGSLPKFSIKWNRNGGILPAGSNAIFGAMGDTLLGGGELSTGGEAILPLSDLFNEMRRMFDTQNRQLISALSSNDQSINLSLNIDGQTLAKKQFKSFKELSRLGLIDMSELV